MQEGTRRIEPAVLLTDRGCPPGTWIALITAGFALGVFLGDFGFIGPGFPPPAWRPRPLLTTTHPPFGALLLFLSSVPPAAFPSFALPQQKLAGDVQQRGAAEALEVVTGSGGVLGAVGPT